jgi:hypothetical protein
VEFKDLAANEASGVVARLLARRSDASLGELQALRGALDEGLRSLEAALNAPPSAEDQQEIEALVGRLAAAESEARREAGERSARELQAAVEKARTDGAAALESLRAESAAALQAIRAENDLALQSASQESAVALERARNEHAAEIEAARGEHAATLESTKASLAAESERTVAEALAQVAALEAECKQQLEDATSLLAERTDALTTAEAALRDARETSEASLHEKSELRRELRELRSGWDAARGEMDSARLALDTARAEAQSFKADLARAEQKIKTLESRKGASATPDAELQALRDELARAEQRIATLEREKASATEMAAAIGGAGSRSDGNSFGRLLALFDRLDKGSSFADVLAALAEALASDYARVAVFTITNNKLENSHQIGFDVDFSNVLSPLSANPSFAHALGVNQAEAPTGAPGTDALRKQFGGSQETALLLPVKIHGEALAVVYADTDGREDAAVTAEFAELLRRHAIPRLEQVRADLKVISELRAYAMLLIDEVEYMHAADVSAGKKDAEVRSGLETNIQCARQMFAQRAASEGPAAVALLEEQLLTVAADKSATRFGKDLGRLEAPSPVKR